MYAAYDGIGIINRNNLHKRQQILSEFWFSQNCHFTCDVYTNDSLHGVCFPTVGVPVIDHPRFSFKHQTSWKFFEVLQRVIIVYHFKCNTTQLGNVLRGRRNNVEQ